MIKFGRIFKSSFFRPDFLEKIDKGLFILLFLLLIFLSADFALFDPSRSVKKSIAAVSEEAADAGYAAGAPKDAKDYSYYGSVLSGKHVFGASFASGSESAPEGPAEIALVGIVPGDRPQAIIENKKTQAVYYVRTGEKFENFIVGEVGGGKVVLYSEGRRTELFFFR